MPETTPLIKAALNLRVGAGFDVYIKSGKGHSQSYNLLPDFLCFNTIRIFYFLL